MDRDRKLRGGDEETALVITRQPGSDAFEGVILAMRVAPTVSRRIVRETLALIGVDGNDATREDLANALPEIERRLREVVTPEVAVEAMQRVRRLLLAL